MRKYTASPEIIKNFEKIKNTKTICIQPNSEIKIQNHHDSEIWHIKNGHGVLYSDNQKIKIATDDIIEFKPFEYHFLINIGESDLTLTTYWYVDWREINKALMEINQAYELNSDNILIGAALPTPNGPLHLGHFAGPYLLLYITSNYYKLLNKSVTTYSGTFGHQNHINRTAKLNNTSYDDLVSKYEPQIIADFDNCGIKYDSFLLHNAYNENPELQKISQELINLLHISNKLVEKEVYYPFSNTTQSFVSESELSGNCPNCNTITISIECENCGLYQDETKLINPFHSDTKEILEKKLTKRLYLLVDSTVMREVIVHLYQQNLLVNKIQNNLIENYIKNQLLFCDIPVSNFRDRGIPVYGEQKLAIPIERALRSYYHHKMFNLIDKHLFFCGIDNFHASCIIVQYIFKVIGISEKLLPKIIMSYHYNLEGTKFSTSKKHVINVNDFLHSNHPDLMRYYLSKTFCSTASKNFSRIEYNLCCEELKNKLLMIFDLQDKLILKYYDNQNCDLTTKNMQFTVEAGGWVREDMEFYKLMRQNFTNCCEQFYCYTPNKAIEIIEAMISNILNYCYDTNDIYKNVPYDYIRTRISLQLFAIKLFAFSIYPILTQLSKKILQTLQINIADIETETVSINIFRNIELTDLPNYIKNNYVTAQ